MPVIGRFKYEIDKLNAVRIWDLENPNENDKPFFYQPDYPDMTPWESRAAAEKWTVDKIDEWLNPPPPEEEEIAEP